MQSEHESELLKRQANHEMEVQRMKSDFENQTLLLKSQLEAALKFDRLTEELKSNATRLNSLTE